LTDTYYVPPEKEKKKIANVPIVQEQSLGSVTDLDINNGNNTDNDNDGNNRNSIPSNFVASSSFVISTPLNVVPKITQSFVPPQIEISFLHMLLVLLLFLRMIQIIPYSPHST
jgi:hypothetical protein